MTAAIANGHAVTLHFRLTLNDGTILDDSFVGDPLVYVHGSGSLVEGLERALTGRLASDEFHLVVEPEDAYGSHDPSAERRVPLSHFPPEVDLQPGMTFQTEGTEEAEQVWVSRVGDNEAVISTNHPLAGQQLNFQVKVLNVREAKPDELSEADT